MAQITGLKEKQEALKEINAKLKSLEPLNLFLKTPNESNEYAVSFAAVKASIYCDNKETIDGFVKAYKEKIVKEINELSEKYFITLDVEDLQIMNELYIPSKGKAKKQTPDNN